MRKRLLFAACLLTAPMLYLHGQVSESTASSPKQTQAAEPLAFEESKGNDLPVGWGGGPPGTVFVDHQVVHSSPLSVRIERNASSASDFSTVTKGYPIDFTGKQIELRGFLRTRDVSDSAGLWLREDGDSGAMLQFDNMQGQHLHGTTGWTEYSIALPLDPAATSLVFGVLQSGTGATWADDLKLFVDGKPLAEAPRVTRPPKKLTPLDNDHEFDSGSRFFLDNLTPVQIENFVTLGQVWGFLKYHHPAITSGQRHWDYDLFRVLPAIAAAKTRAGANAAMVQWIDSLGPLAPCSGCAVLKEKDLQLKPHLSWIYNDEVLGKQLGLRLQLAYQNRPAIHDGHVADAQQFYVSLKPQVHNPSFDHELTYSRVTFPDAGYQLLALYRFWNIMQYWAPNREVAGQDWPEVLREFIPKVALAKDKDAYTLAMMTLIAKANDTHANLWSSLELRPPVGTCRFPVSMRFIDGKAVVTGAPSTGTAAIASPGIASGPAAQGHMTDLIPGDIIKSIDGSSVASLIETWAPYYADSNDAARSRDMARTLSTGKCGPSAVEVIRKGATLRLTAARVPGGQFKAIGSTHDLPGDTFRLLSKDVAYLKLSSIKAADVAHDIELARGTKGLIVDIRNYPSEFVVFALGSLLVTQPTPFATFTSADLSNPGAFYWGPVETLEPAQPHYDGKVVVLVDETSQSQAEYTAMGLRASLRAIIVGSTTAGADGNVSAIPLPGDLSSMVTGLGVFYPDRRPTQRIGIVPDIRVTPTAAGIAAGRDEVLEVAVRQVIPDYNSSQLDQPPSHPAQP